MDLIFDRDGVHVYTGQDTPRADVIDATRAHLLAAGAHPIDVDDALADRPGLVVRAWWAGADVGFCGAWHPDAVAVTVVNLPHGFTERSTP